MVWKVYPRSFPAVISDPVHAALEVQMEEGHYFLGRSADVVQVLKEYHWWTASERRMKRGREWNSHHT
jgi:hypothetical protein